MTRWAAVLAGGTGTRFWPLSTPSRPKQMLPLAGHDPLLVQSVSRLDGFVPPERILVITAASLAERTRDLLPAVPRDNVLVEPRPASTAPALVWATHVARERAGDATVVSMHADWWVGDPSAFRHTGATAAEAAERYDALVTVGIVPTRPETGYGYLEPGDPLDDHARLVHRFTEKPNAVKAAQLVQQGALWNSGLFAWTTSRFFAETLEHAREIAPHLPLLERGDVEGFFAAVTPVAVDVSHFERSQRVVTVPAEFPWDDVGTWSALARVRAADKDRNVLVGEAHARSSLDCTVWADDGAVVLDGVRGLVVVRANGVTLVTTRERAVQLKDLLAELPEHVREVE